MALTFSELSLKLDVLTHDIVAANTASRNGSMLRFVLLLMDGLMMLLLLVSCVAPIPRMVRKLSSD